MRLSATFLFCLAALKAVAQDVLPPQEAFRYTVRDAGGELELNWDIEPGYYMYRARFGFDSRSAGVTLGEPRYPQGKIKEDEFFGRMEVYREQAVIRIPYTASAAADALALELRSQGCADIGLCYPPQTWSTEVRIRPASAEVNLLEELARDPSFSGSEWQEFLPPDQAFVLSAEMADPYTLRARWDIAPGYYLYRDKFGFTAQGELVQTGAAHAPPGVAKHDEYFGDTEVFYDSVEVLVPISRAAPAAGEFELETAFQGCAEDGICYPPMTRTTLVYLPEAGPDDRPSALAMTAAQAPATEQDRLALMIREGTLPLVLASFFGLGLLLAFTPCVLPMIPILSGIIVGQGPDLGTRRALLLSGTYVLAMALTYTAAGVVAALLGQNLQAVFQHPAIIVGFSLIFVLFALAMFGVLELQLPVALQTRLSALSNRQRGGTLAGVAAMGVLSALIVGPCVAAPLAAALIYIGQSGDPVRGGATLFALSLGMGAPLIVFGGSAGRLLPRAGAWMNAVKAAFGVLMLGIAIWMLSRIVPAWAAMLLWAGLALLGGVIAMRASAPAALRVPLRATAVVAFAYAAVLAMGGALGGSDPLRPLAGTPLGGGEIEHLPFVRIKTIGDLERELAVASAAGRPVMLDFYADWCVSCKEMEKYTFTDAAVRAALAETVLLQADVTANDADDRALLERFGIYGPPTIAFFDRDGQELRRLRVVGFVPAQDFRRHLGRALASRTAADRETI